MPNQLSPQETDVVIGKISAELLIVAILKGQHKAGKVTVPWKQIRENGYLPKGVSCDEARVSPSSSFLTAGHLVPDLKEAWTSRFWRTHCAEECTCQDLAGT